MAAGLPLFSARVLGGIFVPGEMRLLFDRSSPVPLRCRPLSRACVSICGVIAAAAAADPCRLGRRKGVWQQRKCHEFKGRKLGRRAGGHGRPRCGSWIRQRRNSHVAERVFFKGNWWRILAAAGQDGSRVVCEWGRGTGIVARCSPPRFLRENSLMEITKVGRGGKGGGRGWEAPSGEEACGFPWMQRPKMGKMTQQF